MQDIKEEQHIEKERQNTGFKREITLFDAIMIVTGGMIGSGIFIVTADISRAVVSPGNMLLVWVLSGFLTMVGAISYGELSSMFPKVGGQYVYLKEAYNKMVAFLYGWTLDRKSTRLNSSHVKISYAVFCWKK